LGAILGVVLMLPFNGMTTGVGNQLTFSEMVFSLQLTWKVAFYAILFGIIMGVLGGLAPAWHAARQNILNALRS
jgi:ABC-type lipoprotein release transport system permease subunit